jgi:hypothetical protein
MCTVTLVRCADPDGGFRLACNRDEARSRPAALSPQLRRFGERRALLPIDPVSQGTWLAVNDAGLALCVLNVNPPDGAWADSRSRGTIIPSLLHCDSADAALLLAFGLPVEDLAPFRLVLADAERTVEVCFNGAALEVKRQTHFHGPVLYTSSGLGDHLVEGTRRQLFEEQLRGNGDLMTRQDAFHRQRWPDRPHLSVCMVRPDAVTVSRSVVEVGGGRARLAYHPLQPDGALGVSSHPQTRCGAARRGREAGPELR